MSRLLPEADVARRYGRAVCTLRRWDADPRLGFPPVIQIRGRNYRDADALDAWDEAQRTPAMTNDDFIHIADAAAPTVIALAFAEFDRCIDALSKLGALVERPTTSLRKVRGIFAEHFARLQRTSTGNQETEQ